ncbi:MAG: PilN domain-containing protein [Patescibacteria group bacterium]
MLNILPPTIKKEVTFKRQYKIALKVFYIFIFILIIPAVLYIGNYIFFSAILNDMDTQNLIPVEQQQNVDNKKQEIINFNQMLKKAEQIQTEHINPVILITELSKLIPSGITVNRMEFSIDKKSVVIAGIATDRDQLSILQDQLSNSEIFTNFKYPISTWSEKENIKFEYTGQINPDYEK